MRMNIILEKTHESPLKMFVYYFLCVRAQFRLGRAFASTHPAHSALAYRIPI